MLDKESRTRLETVLLNAPEIGTGCIISKKILTELVGLISLPLLASQPVWRAAFDLYSKHHNGEAPYTEDDLAAWLRELAKVEDTEHERRKVG